ncbi:NADH-ubiquinone oxidoreductase subunit [Aureobasidium pullulans]|uniref:NADH-ubiquinone oxidoreductase subunit n=1 Tax=Aureobasidium pullulans TaxID=5580 RepID=A0A4S9UIW9_AURPU|nr:NADH-ubiquinone oxidoreductase subunit [Aureobasidium pullulans]
MQPLRQLSGRTGMQLRRSIAQACRSQQFSRPLTNGPVRRELLQRVSSPASIARPAIIRQLNHVRCQSTNTEPPPKSPAASPAQRSRLLRFLYRGFTFLGIFVVVSGVLVVAFFAFDATTYKEESDSVDIVVSELALNPRRGGPKNLPIAEHLIDDDDSPEKKAQKHKPKLVILGTGWGSVALLKQLNPDDYHVTVVSPSNYFLFTPMLPSATVGTLELRSLVEPVRRIISRVKGHFLKATAEDVDFSNKLVEVSATAPDGTKQNFYLPYDKLVIGVGSMTNPHGVKGLEYCNFLKDITDARLIRNQIVRNLEAASIPSTSDEERRRLLSFVVCGGGPTGVEFAAELFDMLNEDLCNYYPRILRNEISVHVIQSRGHILNTYDETLSKYAEARFAKDSVDILTNSRVKEVQKDKILFTQKDENGNTVTKEIPMGFCLWSTGVAQTEFSKKLAEKLGENQTNRHALETDTHLRLVGAPLGDVYAIGDCSTVQNNVSDHIVSFLRTVAWEKGKDPEKMVIGYGDWRGVAKRVKQRFPQAAEHLKRLDKLFEQYDKDKSGTLDFSELQELLKQIDGKMTSLPATAQRANQQGIYLGRKFNKLAQAAPGMELNRLDYGDIDDAVYKAFSYTNMGSLAYVGNAAIFDFGGLNFAGGLVAVYLWRAVYFSQSVSLRTRILLAMDWTKRALFGRGKTMIMLDYKTKSLTINRSHELLEQTFRQRQAHIIDYRLEGKTVVVTGASSGIGKSTAIEFARTSPKNLKLIVTARRLEVLEQLKEEIKKEVGDGVKVLPVKLDVSNPEEVRNFVGNLPEEFKDINVLVNNAGLVKGVAKAPSIAEADIDVMFKTNVTGLINMTQAILPIFQARGESGAGDIINVGSIAGREPYPGGSIYCATKAAVRSFTDALRKELIATRIRVIEVDPGQVETEFSVVRFYGDKAAADKVYEGCEPLTPEDIAEVVVFAAGRRENVVLADSLIFPNHQAAATVMHRKS